MSLQIEKTHPGCRMRNFIDWQECADLTDHIKRKFAEKLRQLYPGLRDAPPNQYYAWVRECGKEHCSHCFEFSLDQDPKKVPMHLKRVVEELAKNGEHITSIKYCACYDVVNANWASAHHGYGPNLEGKIFYRMGSTEFPISGRKLVPDSRLRRKQGV